MMNPAMSKKLVARGLVAVVSIGMMGCASNQKSDQEGARTPQSEQGQSTQGGGASSGVAEKITLSEVRPMVKDLLSTPGSTVKGSGSENEASRGEQRESDIERRERAYNPRGPASVPPAATDESDDAVNLGAGSSGRSR